MRKRRFPGQSLVGPDGIANCFQGVHNANLPAKPEKVYFYATCLVDMFDPEAGLDAITLLEQQGIEVIFKEKQTCCGQPAYSSGYDSEAKQVALSQMALFEEQWPVIVLSGSCGGMMHHHYHRLFKGDEKQQQVDRFCDRVFELTEFLVNVCRIKLNDHGESTSVVMHTSCAARREMNVHVTATQLLNQLQKCRVARTRLRKRVLRLWRYLCRSSPQYQPSYG